LLLQFGEIGAGMILLVTLEFRFTRTPDGQLWSRTSHSYAFWERYLSVFDGVKIVARAEKSSEIDDRYRPVLGPGIQFIEVPYYLGPGQYLKLRRQVRETLRRALDPDDAVLCRVPSRLATELLATFGGEGRPFGLEVIGDPEQAFAPGAVHHPLRPMFRYMFTRNLTRECARAVAVSYVTENALQCRYPARGLAVGVSDTDLQTGYFGSLPRTFTTYYSSTELSLEDYASGPKQYAHVERPRVVFVGSLEQMYKGQDILLKAVALLRQRNCPIELIMVGDGRHKQELQRLAHSLSIADDVRFLGELPAGHRVRAELDKATLMVLPSRTEGLPRVIIEAMARALPCVATRVGGTPELLHDDDLVPPNDPQALARKIEEVITSPARLTLMSHRNLEKAQQFRPEVLRRKRTEFYMFLREATREWTKTAAQPLHLTDRLRLGNA
jgi:glycosyltransferase involved in cell wall biosynthesis